MEKNLKERENLSGFLLINKPKDITSYDCIRYLKKIISRKIKISHTGTLDPFATGLLIIAISREYTKQSDSFSILDKEYIATGKFGELTDTLDYTGKIIKTCDKILNKSEIEKAIENIGSKYVQTPPIYSALKYGGKPLYELAREKKISDSELKKIVHAKSREVDIHSLELADFNYPFFKIKAKVSHGTYIRSLVNDIARQAGNCATTYELQRLSIGSYSIDKAIDLYGIKNLNDIEKNLHKNQLNQYVDLIDSNMQ